MIRETFAGLPVYIQIPMLSVLTIAVFCTFWEGMIFERVKDWVESKIGEYWTKPLMGCYVCGTFWYGAGFALLLGWPWYLNIPAMGVSAIISQWSNN